MSTAIQIKRHVGGSALVNGTAPLTAGAGGIKSGELVYDATGNILYIGKGDDGAGNSQSIVAVGGATAFLLAALLGVANGVASLDSGGKIPLAQIPASVTGAMSYQGTWNATTNSPAISSGVGTKGFFYKVSVAGATAIDGTSNWNIGDIITFDGAVWDKIDGPAEAVVSVAGRIGAVTIGSADITDAGVVGKQLLQAATAAIAKAALSLVVADISGAAPLASPGLTGTPTAPTAAAGTNTTQLATTAFVLANPPSAIDGGSI